MYAIGKCLLLLHCAVYSRGQITLHVCARSRASCRVSFCNQIVWRWLQICWHDMLWHILVQAACCCASSYCTVCAQQ